MLIAGKRFVLNSEVALSQYETQTHAHTHTHTHTHIHTYTHTRAPARARSLTEHNLKYELTTTKQIGSFTARNCS
jgi:hypothetical protein